MPLIIIRASNTVFKKNVVTHLVSKLHFQLFDPQDESLEAEKNNLLEISNVISNLLAKNANVLLSASFYDDKALYSFINMLEIPTKNIFFLLRTKENNLPSNSTKFENELIIESEINLDKLAIGILNIAKTLQNISPLIVKIQNTPEGTLLLNNSDLLYSTSVILHSFPVYGLMQMIISVLKLYYIDEDKSKALDLILELIKLIPVQNFKIRKGAKFYRVCYYKENGDYTHFDQVWYVKSSKHKVRMSSYTEPVLFVGDHERSSFLEVYQENETKRPFITLEVEVIKPFDVVYIAPLHLNTKMGASKNRMYVDYVKKCKNKNSELLDLKEELIRNFIGNLMIINKHFDKDFTYEFTNHISNFLLNRFKGISIAYLSTQSNYQYNNFAIPAQIADECLKPGKVLISSHTFWPNGKGKNPWIHFENSKEGYVDPLTRNIVYVN
jgi:hypothetical protein